MNEEKQIELTKMKMIGETFILDTFDEKQRFVLKCQDLKYNNKIKICYGSSEESNRSIKSHQDYRKQTSCSQKLLWKERDETRRESLALKDRVHSSARTSALSATE